MTRRWCTVLVAILALCCLIIAVSLLTPGHRKLQESPIAGSGKATNTMKDIRQTQKSSGWTADRVWDVYCQSMRDCEDIVACVGAFALAMAEAGPEAVPALMQMTKKRRTVRYGLFGLRSCEVGPSLQAICSAVIQIDRKHGTHCYEEPMVSDDCPKEPRDGAVRHAWGMDSLRVIEKLDEIALDESRSEQQKRRATTCGKRILKLLVKDRSHPLNEWARKRPAEQ